MNFITHGIESVKWLLGRRKAELETEKLRLGNAALREDAELRERETLRFCSQKSKWQL